MSSDCLSWPPAHYIGNACGGQNWVVSGRRTPRIVARYGEDVVVIAPKRFNAIIDEWQQRNSNMPAIIREIDGALA